MRMQDGNLTYPIITDRLRLGAYAIGEITSWCLRSGKCTYDGGIFPMPNLTVGDIVETKSFCYGGGQLGINILHWEFSQITTGTLTDGAAAAEFSTAFANVMKNCIGAAYEWIGLTFRRVTPAPTPSIIVTADAGPGLTAGDSLPRQMCGIATKLTAVPGRAGRGRVYFPFATENDNEVDGEPEAGYRLRMDTAMAFMCSLFAPTPPVVTGVQFTPVIYNRLTQTAIPITGWIVRNKWASQRRRGDYGQANTRPF